jgi:hypothetical protein
MADVTVDFDCTSLETGILLGTVYRIAVLSFLEPSFTIDSQVAVAIGFLNT